LLALRRGDYARARSQLQEALGIFTRAGTTENLVQVRRDLASVHAAMGDLRSALDQLRRAELLLARMAEPGDLAADVALARGDLATLLNTYAIAEHQYGIAQTIYRRASNALGEAEAQQGRAMLLVERKQYAQALELLGFAKRVQTASGDRRPAALTELLIGHTQQEQGNLALARRTFAHALDTLRALGDVGGEAAALVALGDLDLEAESPLAAEAQYRRALDRLTGRAVPTVSWQAHAGLGRALRARGALDEAAAELRASIVDVERTARTLPLAERRATFLGDKWDAFADLALTERALGDAAASFTTSERMRARQMLDVLSRGRIARATPADTTLSAREQDLRLRIGDLTQRLESEEGGVRTLRGPDLSGAASGVTREALARAQEQYAQLLLELRDEKGYGSMVAIAPAPWRVVAARLKRGQAMLTYLVTDSTTMVFVLTPDTMRVLDLNVGRVALAALVDFARGTMARRSPAAASWRTPLARLHQQLISPIEDAGLLMNVRQLVIVPHAELHYLPFAALVRRGTKDEFLVERYDIGYAPSATAWVQLGTREWPMGNRVLALAPRDQQLPGSRDEVEAIRGLYGSDATVLTGAAATEQVFRATVRRYDIVHLATYGVLNQHNPLFSFVELNRGGGDDGRLEVHEVFALSLNARLLVLSACQTALASGAVSDVPAGDDWVGLVRAFLGAGAQNVIATLWAVEDRSTARVMERLHKRLRAGDAEAAALSQAQRETLRNPATAGPFYWAGFVLVGGGR
jgi:CHAT domain-containing protein